MRRLLPDPADEQLDDLYLALAWPQPPGDRPHCYLDMVASVDGAATVEGRTGGLGGAADRLAFSRLREWCDAILVGAGTVRVESYGPPRPGAAARTRRQQRGLVPVPPLIVVTASAALDPGSRLFSDPARRPVVLTVDDADAGRLEAVADVMRVGRGRVDLRAAFEHLRDRGVTRLLCEGGPHLNAGLLAAGLVDDLFLTIAPQLAAEPALRIVEPGVDAPPPAPRTVELIELREHDGELLARYRLA